MKLENNRVLGRIGARELTPEEIARVSGGVRAISATTNIATNVHLGMPPEHGETDDH